MLERIINDSKEGSALPKGHQSETEGKPPKTLMELMQLEMFVAVVQEGSLQAAAERVYRSQPAVSVAIKKLEQRVASPLFDRSKRRDYSLTPAGEVLYSYASRLVSLRYEAVAAMEGLRELKQGLSLPKSHLAYESSKLAKFRVQTLTRTTLG